MANARPGCSEEGVVNMARKHTAGDIIAAGGESA